MKDIHGLLADLLPHVEKVKKKATLTVDGVLHPFYAFRPLPSMPDQALFMDSEAGIQAFYGANKIGKSMCGDQKCAERMVGFNPRFPERHYPTPIRVWLCSPARFTRDMFRDFVKRVPKDFVDDVSWSRGEETLTLRNGSTAKVKSYSMSVDEFQRDVVDIVRFDEEPPEYVWAECFARIAARNGIIMLTFTPVKGTSWMHKKLRGLLPRYRGLRDGDFAWFHGRLDDNPTLNSEGVRRFKAEMEEEGEDAFAVRVEGRYLVLAGSLIFSAEMMDPIWRRHGRDPAFVMTFDLEGNPELKPWSEKARGWFLWEKRLPHASYVIGADPCRGIARGDFASAHVACVSTGEIVASYHGLTEPFDFGIELLLAGRYFNNALLAPEMNMEGAAVLQALRMHNYPRIYHRETFSGRIDQMAPDYGWLTTSRSKEPMIQCLRAALLKAAREEPGGILLHDTKTMEELSNFGYLHEHRSGTHGMAGLEGHDDRVISLAITVMAMRQAPPGKVLTADGIQRSYIQKMIQDEIVTRKSGFAWD